MLRPWCSQGEGRLSLEERPMPAVTAPDDVLIAVEACGICGTDVQILNVPPGHPATPGTIMGHEFVGRVEAVGRPRTRRSSGERVDHRPRPQVRRLHLVPRRPARRPALNVRGPGHLPRRRAGQPRASRRPAPATPSRTPCPARDRGARGAARVRHERHPAGRRAAGRVGRSSSAAGAIGCLFRPSSAPSGASPIVVVEPRAERAPTSRGRWVPTVVVTPDELAARSRELLPDGADIVVDAVGQPCSARPSTSPARAGGSSSSA